MKIHVKKGRDGQYYWHAVARNGRTVADGAEGYTRLGSAIRAARAFLRAVILAELVIDED